MAKLPPRNASSEQDGEMSFTMVKFTLKGSDTSLQKGMDAIRSAFAQAGFSPAQPDTRLPRVNGLKQIAAGESEVEIAEEVDAVETSVDEFTETPVRKATAPRKAPSYKIMNELVFDDVSPTLADFCAERDPQTDLDRYKCIAYWFKHTKGAPDLSVAHFFTA